MTFEDYVAELQQMAVECGATDPGKPYCDPEAWREAFEEGLTTGEAWRAEEEAAATMLG